MSLKKIEASKISEVQALCIATNPPRPVWLMKYQGGHLQVLKAERALKFSEEGQLSQNPSGQISTSRVSYNNTAFLMEFVMKAPQSRAVSTEERTELLKIAREKFTPPRGRELFIDMLKSKGHFFTILEFIGGLKDIGAGAEQVQNAYAFLNAINTHDKFVVNIGKLAMLDLFVGNYDRFDYTGEVSNLGNLFFRLDGNKPVLVALDSFHDFSSHATLTGKLDVPSSQKHMGENGFYRDDTGVKLTIAGSSQVASDHAVTIMESLSKELKRILAGDNRVNTQKEYIFDDYQRVINLIFEGITNALSKLSKAKKTRMKTKSGLPQALANRYDQFISRWKNWN